MAEPLPEVPPELVASLGDALKGWHHMTDSLSSTLPTSLKRANRVRRGALLYLGTPKRPKG